MAFPYDLEDTFENGGTAFDAETDTQGILTFPSYRSLCRTPPFEPPYRGAYCMKIDLASQSGETEASIQHNALDMAADVTRFIRWHMYVHNLVMAASDRIQIFAIRATNTEHVIVEIFNNAGDIQLRCGQTSGGTLRACSLVQNAWHSIELGLAYDGAGDAGGTIDFYVDEVQVGAQITGLTQGASTRFNLGTFIGGNTVAASNINTGVTSGILLFDQFVLEGTAGTAGTRNYGLHDRFQATQILTKTGHAAVGPGQIEDAYILDGGSGDTTLTLYDSDRAEPYREIFLPMPGTSGNRIEQVENSLGFFKRGCYVVLAGTNPRAAISFRRANLDVASIQNQSASVA